LSILQYAFMQRALVAAVLIGAICALVGVYVVLRGLSFIGSGIAHASFGGVALGYLLGFNLVLTALGFCLLTAFGIGWVTKRGQVREDAAIGVFFASTMALGILIIGLLRGYNVDLFGYLFGSILAVGTTDLWSTVGLALLVIIIVGVFFKELLIITFDPVTARAMGLPVDLLYFLLLGLLAVTVVISIKVVGIVLVSALIVTPAADDRAFGAHWSAFSGGGPVPFVLSQHRVRGDHRAHFDACVLCLNAGLAEAAQVCGCKRFLEPLRR
jgi:ABC-type Mn2+/Zn2+ transport system permease subunit